MPKPQMLSGTGFVSEIVKIVATSGDRWIMGPKWPFQNQQIN